MKLLFFLVLSLNTSIHAMAGMRRVGVKTMVMMMIWIQSPTHLSLSPWLPVLPQEMPTQINKEMNLLRNLLTSAKKKMRGRRVTGRVMCWWRWTRDHRNDGTVRAF